MRKRLIVYIGTLAVAVALYRVLVGEQCSMEGLKCWGKIHWYLAEFFGSLAVAAVCAWESSL